MNRRNTLFGLACFLLAPTMLLAVTHERPQSSCKDCKKCGRLCKCDCKDGCKCKPGCCKVEQSDATRKPHPSSSSRYHSRGGRNPNPRYRGRSNSWPSHPQHRGRSSSGPSRSRGASDSHPHHKGPHLHRGRGGVCPQCKRNHNAKPR